LLLFASSSAAPPSAAHAAVFGNIEMPLAVQSVSPRTLNAQPRSVLIPPTTA
jgi:hypothetical protein